MADNLIDVTPELKCINVLSNFHLALTTNFTDMKNERVRMNKLSGCVTN